MGGPHRFAGLRQAQYHAGTESEERECGIAGPYEGRRGQSFAGRSEPSEEKGGGGGYQTAGPHGHDDGHCDGAGYGIICTFTSDIYRIADAITNQNDVTTLKIKDYIANPKPNGYTSYHMIVSVPIFLSNDVIDTKVEIQIRTIAMDFWASLEHKIYYKFEGKAPEGIREELRECANIISFLDQKMLSINESVKNYHKDFNGGDVVNNDIDSISNTLKPLYGSIYTD